MIARVLVVDDEPLIAMSIQAFLEDEGMLVQSVSSAEDALDLVQSGSGFDVCVIDMRLPGMDGNAAIRALHGTCPALRYLVYTGSANYVIPAELQAMTDREIPLLRKPLFDMNMLVTRVRDLAEVQSGLSL